MSLKKNVGIIVDSEKLPSWNLESIKEIEKLSDYCIGLVI